MIAALAAALWPLSLSFAQPWMGDAWLSVAGLWWAFLAAYLIAFTIVRTVRRAKRP